MQDGLMAANFVGILAGNRSGLGAPSRQLSKNKKPQKQKGKKERGRKTEDAEVSEAAIIDFLNYKKIDDGRIGECRWLGIL